MHRKVVWAVLAAAVILGGCASPENRIKRSCVRNGGFSSSEQSRNSEAAERQCACFARQLKSSLPDEQLEAVAKIMEKPKSEQDVAMRQTLSAGTYTAILGAAKSCALQ